MFAFKRERAEKNLLDCSTPYLKYIGGNHAHFRERDLNEREIVFIFLEECMKGFAHKSDSRYLKMITILQVSKP